jgi:hypothetical protein
VLPLLIPPLEPPPIDEPDDPEEPLPDDMPVEPLPEDIPVESLPVEEPVLPLPMLPDELPPRRLVCVPCWVEVRSSSRPKKAPPEEPLEGEPMPEEVVLPLPEPWVLPLWAKLAAGAIASTAARANHTERWVFLMV